MLVSSSAAAGGTSANLVDGVTIKSGDVLAIAATGGGTATVPVAISKFAQEYEIKNGVMAAGVVLSIVPAIVLLLFAHRHIVKGLTAGVGK